MLISYKIYALQNIMDKLENKIVNALSISNMGRSIAPGLYTSIVKPHFKNYLYDVTNNEDGCNDIIVTNIKDLQGQLEAATSQQNASDTVSLELSIATATCLREVSLLSWQYYFKNCSVIKNRKSECNGSDLYLST